MSALGYFKCTYSREKILLFADAPLNSWTDTIRWCVKSNTSEHCYEISWSVKESSEQIVLFTGEEVVRERFEILRWVGFLQLLSEICKVW